MRWLLVFFLALIPSVVLSESIENNSEVGTVVDPCVKKDSGSPIMDYELSTPYLLIANNSTAGPRADGNSVRNPCPTVDKDKAGVEEGHKIGDPWEDNPYLRLFPN